RFLTLPNGIPSADTFERVFAKLDPQAFARAFGRWMSAACQATGLIPIALDGKSVRGSKKATATGCLHLVSAWATEARLTLGQVSVPEGSNEIAVIPELLSVLELKGALVALDAAGCQKAIARRIREQGGDYLLAVSGSGCFAAFTSFAACFSVGGGAIGSARLVVSVSDGTARSSVAGGLAWR